MNLCLSLITRGHHDTAFLILRTFPSLQADDVNADSANLGNFFLRHCINMDTVIDVPRSLSHRMSAPGTLLKPVLKLSSLLRLLIIIITSHKSS